MVKQNRLHSILAFALLLIGAVLGVSGAGAFPASPTDSPGPLPNDCQGVTEPGEEPPICCASGYVYYSGLPVGGARVVIQSASGVFTTTTGTGTASTDPYYAIALSESPLHVSPGETITLTARYPGLSARTGNSATGSTVYQVVAGGQQVDVVIPVAEGDQSPIGTINYIQPNPALEGQDTIQFAGSGADQDEDGASIVAWQWRSSLDGVLSTQKSFTKPASELSIGTHTIYFKVQDDEGKWSQEVSRTLTVGTASSFTVKREITDLLPDSRLVVSSWAEDGTYVYLGGVVQNEAAYLLQVDKATWQVTQTYSQTMPYVDNLLLARKWDRLYAATYSKVNDAAIFDPVTWEWWLVSGSGWQKLLDTSHCEGGFSSGLLETDNYLFLVGYYSTCGAWGMKIIRLDQNHQWQTWTSPTGSQWYYAENAFTTGDRVLFAHKYPFDANILFEDKDEDATDWLTTWTVTGYRGDYPTIFEIAGQKFLFSAWTRSDNDSVHFFDWPLTRDKRINDNHGHFVQVGVTQAGLAYGLFADLVDNTFYVFRFDAAMNVTRDTASYQGDIGWKFIRPIDDNPGFVVNEASGKKYLVTVAPVGRFCEIGGFVETSPPGAAEVLAFENSIDRHVRSIMFYQGWNATDQPPFPAAALNDGVRYHDGYDTQTILHLTWEPYVSLRDIADGVYDSYLNTYAAEVRAWGDPIRLRFAHEMIQDNAYDDCYGQPDCPEWYPWQDQPDDYRAAFQHVVDVFRAAGAANVEFVWCPNHYPFDLEVIQQYYPGSNYVDWLCMDGYNWTNQDGQPGWPDWQWFQDIFTGIYRTFVDHPDVLGDKPIMIGEFASAEAGEHDQPGQTKAAWIADAFAEIRSPDFSKVRAFYWFHVNKEGQGEWESNWRVDTSPESLAAFRTAMADPYFTSHPVGAPPRLSVNDVTVPERDTGAVNAVFTVTLSAASGQEVTVDYATTDGSATAGNDYVAANGTLTFPAGTTAQTITVVVNGDTLDEPDETFFVSLSNPTNATLADGQAVGTIEDDDSPHPQVRTLILSNRAKIESLYGTSEASQLMGKLGELAAHSGVQGLVVQVENDPAVAAAYSQWEANNTTTRANAVTDAIKNLLNGLLDTYSDVEYIVLVGDDQVIPYRRVPDQTDPQWRESSYGCVSSSSTIGVALGDDMILTDDFYADRVPTVPDDTNWDGHALYIPDYALGRLIETPSEIIAIIDTFLADSNIAVGSAISVGYDFVQDGAQEMCDAFTADGIPADCTLIGDWWSASQFRSRVLGIRHEIISLNQHAHHSGLGAPAGGGISSSDFASAGGDLTRAIFYSVGCHAGLNVPPANPCEPLDLAQAIAQNSANYLTNTGYGWGYRASVGLSEKLMLKFTKQLLSGQSATLGEAVVKAKQDYYGTEHDFDYYDEKIMIEAGLLGLPMYRFTTPAALASARFTDVVEAARFTTLANGLSKNSVTYQFPALISETTDDGAYYSLDGVVESTNGQPIQPKYATNADFPGTTAHGLVFTGGLYGDIASFDPVVEQALTLTLTSPIVLEPPFTALNWHPATFFRLNRLETLSGMTADLVAVLGQFNPNTGVERLYDEMSFDIYYHTMSDDWSPPDITRVTALLDGDGARIAVETSDPAGIHTVVVAYTDGAGVWSSITLTETNQLWSGTILNAGGSEFFVQVVDSAGNVAVDDNSGSYYTATCALADTNCDGAVNIVDIQTTASHWGIDFPETGYVAQYDLDFNGQIDVADIQAAALRWHQIP